MGAGGGKRTGTQRSWYSTKEFWIALAVLLVVSFIWLDAGRANRPDLVERADTEIRPAPFDRGSFDANVVESSVVLAASSSANGESPPFDIKPPPDCKRAPIRGCAPNKDERGCYHCARCWRPYHYDAEHAPNAVSFSCQEMPDGALYVELTESGGTIASQRWLVSVSFEGKRLEQPVSPNLGGAFYSGFHGGTIELTAKLDSCDGPSSSCRGDVDVIVNARPEERR
jgi:hypothetical protein